jgi:quinol monooxygenase YgiN
MTRAALLELSFSRESLDRARTVLHRILEETRGFDGCLGVEVLIGDDETSWTVVEHWQSEEHDNAYREFRNGPGAITDLGPLLSAPPRLTTFAIADDI